MERKIARKSGRQRQRQRMVFLEDLVDHSVREAFVGAAEYAADCSDLDFEPWPLTGQHTKLPTRADFREIDCVLLTERAAQVVFGRGARIEVPHVFFLDSPNHRKAPFVGFNDHSFGLMAAEHLINRGYRNLVSITSSDLPWSQMRAAGFEEGCRIHKILPKQFQLHEDVLPVYWQSNFARRHRKLYEILDEIPKPCGIFAANDVIACFLIETARSHGIAVPHEVGVVGVDNDPIPNAAAGLAISSIQPPFRQVGHQAAQLLDSLRKGNRNTKRVLLEPVRVVVRTSTDTFMVDDPLLQKAQAFIEERRENSVRVSEITRALRTSAVTLGNHFQRHLQMTPAQYILLRRIDHAKDLLREGRLNVEEVSAACNFHSCSYFCQIFKKVTSMSPGQIRRAAVPV